MTYKGFEILLERQTCEYFTLDKNGEPAKFIRDCNNSEHDGYFAYVAFIDGNNVADSGDLDSLKAYLDKVEEI